MGTEISVKFAGAQKKSMKIANIRKEEEMRKERRPQSNIRIVVRTQSAQKEVRERRERRAREAQALQAAAREEVPRSRVRVIVGGKEISSRPEDGGTWVQPAARKAGRKAAAEKEEASTVC